jgi:hypothetical protein
MKELSEYYNKKAYREDLVRLMGSYKHKKKWKNK